MQRNNTFKKSSFRVIKQQKKIDKKFKKIYTQYFKFNLKLNYKSDLFCNKADSKKNFYKFKMYYLDYKYKNIMFYQEYKYKNMAKLNINQNLLFNFN